MATDADDGVLWSRAAMGNREALGMLLIRHAERVRTSARAAGLVESDAADAVQETFARALLHWRDLKGPESLGAWLGQTARNVAIDWIRRRARAPLPPPASDENKTWDPPDLSGLAGADQEILRLRYGEGLTGPEIAARLDLPLETVKKRLQRARTEALERLGRRRGP